MQIIETSFPETLHKSFKSALLSNSLYSSTKTEWFDIMQNRQVIDETMMWMFDPVESWIKTNYFSDIISYNFDGSYQTDEGVLIDWHTDS